MSQDDRPDIRDSPCEYRLSDNCWQQPRASRRHGQNPFIIQGDTKKPGNLKNPTKIEEIQEKNY